MIIIKCMIKARYLYKLEDTHSLTISVSKKKSMSLPYWCQLGHLLNQV